MGDVPGSIAGPDGVRYLKGKFLGKGGFARCYELKDAATGVIHAARSSPIVCSRRSTRRTRFQCDRSKRQRMLLFEMTQEIAIHRSLGHAHVVGFTAFFEDSDNVYILLELCTYGSLQDVIKKRRTITEPEARYFSAQIIDGVNYLHLAKIIHRDLKLANILLNDEMAIKISDFGISAKLADPKERRLTCCGTPNYIAPEMLNKKGHSFEVDIWAIGCILYTLLVGKPPFAMQSLKETYKKINKNDYHTPSLVSQPARDLIAQLLAPEATHRPTIFQLKEYTFFTNGYLPKTLPACCLRAAPEFPPNHVPPLPTTAARRALGAGAQVEADLCEQVVMAVQSRALANVPENDVLPRLSASDADLGHTGDAPPDIYLRDLITQLKALINANRNDKPAFNDDDALDLAATP